MRFSIARNYPYLAIILRSQTRSESVQKIFNRTRKFLQRSRSYFQLLKHMIRRRKRMARAAHSCVESNSRLLDLLRGFSDTTIYLYGMLLSHLQRTSCVDPRLPPSTKRFRPATTRLPMRTRARRRSRKKFFSHNRLIRNVQDLIMRLCDSTASHTGYNVGTYIASEPVFKKLLNYLMRDGKRFVSLRIVFRALSYIRQYYVVNPMNILYGVLHNTIQMFDYHLLQVGRWRYIIRPFFLSPEDARVRPVRYIFNQIQAIQRKYMFVRGRPRPAEVDVNDVIEMEKQNPVIQKALKWLGRRGGGKMKYRGRSPVLYIGRTKYVLSKYLPAQSERRKRRRSRRNREAADVNARRSAGHIDTDVQAENENAREQSVARAPASSSVNADKDGEGDGAARMESTVTAETHQISVPVDGGLADGTPGRTGEAGVPDAVAVVAEATAEAGVAQAESEPGLTNDGDGSSESTDSAKADSDGDGDRKADNDNRVPSDVGKQKKRKKKKKKKKAPNEDVFPELTRCRLSLSEKEQDKDLYLKMYMCVGAALLRLYKNPQIVSHRVGAVAGIRFENRKYVREKVFTLLRSKRYRKRGLAYSPNVRLWNWSKQWYTRNVLSRKRKRAAKPVPLHLRKRFGR
jgi:ribosomal protein S7